MTTKPAPRTEAAYGSLIWRLAQPVTEKATARLDYVPEQPTRKPNRYAAAAKARAEQREYEAHARVEAAAEMAAENAWLIHAEAGDPETWRDLAEHEAHMAEVGGIRGEGCLPRPPANHKGADCLTPGTPRNPGTHAFCMDAACVCTCHGKIARKARAAAPSTEVLVRPGTYTVGTSDADYTTLRVRDADWAREKGVWGVTATTQTVAFLSGSDNESDYTSFGFLTGSAYKPFKRFADNAKLRQAVLALTNGPEAAGLAYAERSGNCYRCSRKLTVPTSLAAGLGPECAKKV